MLQTSVASTTALKEWAITVEALGAGTQIFVLRKGGIHEETRHFQIESNQFFLFPAYEHQKKELLKPKYHADLKRIVEEYAQDRDKVTIRYFANLYDDIELGSEEQLYSLEEDHICTNQFAFERYKWKIKQPLHLLVMRVYQLHHPFSMPVSEEYLGCKSWFQLPYQVDSSMVTPVVDEAVFLQRVKAMKEKLVQCEPKDKV